MNIIIEGKKGTYRLTSDDDNFILAERKIITKKDEAGTKESVWRIFAYPTQLKYAINTLITLEVRRSDATTLVELKQALEGIRLSLKEQLNEEL